MQNSDYPQRTVAVTRRVNAVSPALRAVQVRIREVMNEVTDDLATGTAKDFPEYRNAVGVIAGLAYAEAILLDLDEKIVNSEEE